MIHLLKHKFKLDYFSDTVGREVKEVYLEATIMGLAVSLVMIFEPIYLYNLGYNIIQILWFYALVYVCYAVLAPFGAMFASRFGYKHAILVSNLFYIGYWAALFLIGAQPWLWLVAPILFALQKSFFWPAFHADVALSSGGRQRSREVGVLYALIEVAFIIGPVLGGLISAQFGFASLFMVASTLILLSAAPLFLSPEIYTQHQFRFRNLWRIIKNHVDHFFGYWGYAEDLMLQSLWPIYIFILIPDFFNVGLLVTLATLAGAIIMLYVGRRADLSGQRRQILQFSSWLYGLTWVFRFLARGLTGVFVFDALSKIGRDVVRIPEMSISYQTAGTSGPDHAIAYGVFREASLAVGKVVTALLGILIMAYFGEIQLVFILAGVFTMFYAILKPRK